MEQDIISHLPIISIISDISNIILFISIIIFIIFMILIKKKSNNIKKLKKEKEIIETELQNNNNILEKYNKNQSEISVSEIYKMLKEILEIRVENSSTKAIFTLNKNIEHLEHIKTRYYMIILSCIICLSIVSKQLTFGYILIETNIVLQQLLSHIADGLIIFTSILLAIEFNIYIKGNKY